MGQGWIFKRSYWMGPSGVYCSTQNKEITMEPKMRNSFGTGDGTKTAELWEKFQGGGAFLIHKSMLHILGL